MSFSKRNGIIPEKAIQVNFMDDELRMSIWNCFYMCFYSDMTKPGLYEMASNNFFSMYIHDLWNNFLKKDIGYIPLNTITTINEVRVYYNKFEWNKVYDFCEFNIGFLRNYNQKEKGESYKVIINSILEREASGYRFIGSIAVPILNSIEIDEVKTALFNTPYEGINTHLTKALEKFSDRKSPDFRNSIKESISAVDCLCREITGESTLGEALKKLEQKGIKFNKRFKEGLEKIYAYTNDKSTGIRHALIGEGETPDFDDAKFMIVLCSAFINYIISKNNK